MNFKFYFYLLFICILGAASTALHGQALNHKQGELLVRIAPEIEIQSFLIDFEARRNKPVFIHATPVVVSHNIWLLHYDFTQHEERKLKAALWQEEAIQKIQYNHLVSSRVLPDDPRFDAQWHHVNLLLNGSPEADMDSDLAWDIATGGLTPLGDTIVLAIIDSGVDIDHPDLQNRVWINHQEIPNNGIDDDANGYIDDYSGFNTNQEDGEINGDDHGTAVAGIIGATGNNATGVTGINWNSKLMIIKNNFNTSEANVLMAYGYAYNMRRRYNLTKGQEGAFVVATNSSWGRDSGQPEDAPLWCEFYDELGAQGIVNCAATTNRDIDVDLQGDLPTACNSPYLVTVTNLNSFGEKVNAAGYGSRSIDLGAFGDGVFTTLENAYGSFGGTSAACPMVTGLVGLLYAAPCDNLTTIARDDPKSAADFAIDYILQGTKTNASLQAITQTGGQLNLHNSLSQMMNDCRSCSLPSGIENILSEQTQETISWTAFNSALAVNLQYRAQGEISFNTVLNVEPPYTLTGLEPCTSYDFQLEAICGDTTSSYTELEQFNTSGCCQNPTQIQIEFQNESQVFIVWPSAELVTGYELQFRQVLNEDWILLDTALNSFVDIQDLEACTDYILQVKAICSGAMDLPWSDNFTFATTGCGICTEGAYCESKGLSTASEWIESIQVHTTEIKSGNNEGYITHESAPIKLSIEGDYQFRIRPGYANQALPELVQVWIDFDQNAEFDEEELVLISDPIKETWQTRLQIPNMILGETKMRVKQSWVGDEDNPILQSACDDILFGEVEDFCIEIVAKEEACAESIVQVDILSSDMSSAIISWDKVNDADEYAIHFNSLGEANFIVLYTDQNQTIINGLDACQPYEVSIAALCNGFASTPSQPIIFSTECNPLDATNAVNSSDYRVLQNPFSEVIAIQMDVDIKIHCAELYSIQGHAILTPAHTRHGDIVRIAAQDHLSIGIYILRLDTNKGDLTIKLIKS